jgi:hypothetical protein
MFVFPLCSVFVAGCMNTPPLVQATDGRESHVMIRDVVQRVKCELSNAFDEKTEQPEYRWLSNWVAHADLTLTIADNAGLSPTGSFTQTLHSQLNHDVGPAGLVGGKFPAVGQSFVVSAGANLSGTATRTETLSFTVALNELKMWRRALDRLEAAYPPEKRSCNFGAATGITGNLGLEEWVDAAFYPAEIRQLEAGIHSAASPKLSSVSSPSSGQQKNANPAGGINIGAWIDNVKKWQRILTAFDQEIACPTSPGSSAGGSNKTTGLASSVKAGAKSSSSGSDQQTCNKTLIQNADTTLKSVEDTVNENKKQVSKYQAVLASYLKKQYAFVDGELQIADRNVKVCNDALTKLIANIGDGQRWAKQLLEALEAPKDGNFKPLQRTDSVESLQNYDELSTLYNELETLVDSDYRRNVVPGTDAILPDVKSNPFIVQIAQCGKAIQQIQSLSQNLPTQVDPPIDGISHSLTFVLNYNASITPSWSLIQWKGPGQTGNFFSAGGVRTHGLVIALSAPNGNSSFTEEQSRLIQLQAIRSIAGQ